jgi:L-lactate dehydrogenase
MAFPGTNGCVSIGSQIEPRLELAARAVLGYGSASLNCERKPHMKVGILGTGAVGSACALALVSRGSAREIVLVNKTRKRAEAVAADIRYGAVLSPPVEIYAGDYQDLAGATLIMITAGVNEKTGGATDRNDPAGRLRLLAANAQIYHDIIPKTVQAAPDAILLIVTDPPDALADTARRLAKHDRVLSTGTFLDSLRFRTQIAAHFNVAPASVEAQVLGEHGTSQVFAWSSARIAGVPILMEIERRGINPEEFKSAVERDVRYANITIIEGNDASQYGIGIASARIAEAVLRDERTAIPIGSYHPRYGITLSLPSVVGRTGVVEVLEPDLSADESEALRRSVEALKKAEAAQ